MPKGGNDYLRIGDYNAICDICGMKYKASQLKENWQGFMVCEKDFEYRHPMDFQKVPRTEATIPWSRPEGPDRYED